MTSPWFTDLPDDWHTRDVEVIPWSGCWIWTHPTMPWQVARELIARQRRLPIDSGCAVTAACIHPYHSPNTTRPPGGAS